MRKILLLIFTPVASILAILPLTAVARGHVDIGVGIGVGPYYGPPAYYYPPSYYYAPPPVYYAPAPRPRVYEPVVAPAEAPNAWWYFCEPARAYYPYVKECPAAWQRMPAPPRNDSGPNEAQESAP